MELSLPTAIDLPSEFSRLCLPTIGMTMCTAHIYWMAKLVLGLLISSRPNCK